MRIIDQDVLDELNSGEDIYPIGFVKMIINTTDPSRTLRFHTGYNDITVGSEVYTAAGNLLGISPVEEQINVRQNNIDVLMSGLDASFISIIESENIIGSRIEILAGYLNQNTGQLVAPPYISWIGLANDYAVEYKPEDLNNSNTIVIKLSCRNIITAILETVNGRFTSKESFQRNSPDDLSMAFTPDLTRFNPRFGED